MKGERQNLKPLWIKYLNELFEKAEKKNAQEIDVSALTLQKMAKKEYPGVDFNRFPSICNAMRSIKESDSDEEIYGVFNSSTYTVKYKLPRLFPTKENITNYNLIHNDSFSIKNNDIQIKIDVPIKNNLIKVHDVLFQKRFEMKDFMKYYVFEKMTINMDSFLEDKDQFLLYIDFCLKTRNKVVNKDLDEGKKYFNKNYGKIVEYINEKNIENLKQIIYSSPGVGQKIGSMLLEFIYFYTKHYDEDIIRTLFLPIDTHIKRIFYDSFNVETPNIGSHYTSRQYLQFQYLLDKYSNNRGRVYFDYLWFVGKMFCTKVTNEKSKGYRICNYCWIKEYCENKKWL
jgi:endonuclease III/DNA-binding Xre family transcriptional regulator